jgi:glycosyltransferase involved in cell wall biosynthesis
MTKNRIKVVFIFGALGGGGAQRQFGHLVNHIDRKRFRPIIISVGRTEKETQDFCEKYSDDDMETNTELSKINFENYYLYRKLKCKKDIYFISKYNNSKLKIQYLIYKVIKEIKPDISIGISPFAAGISIFPIYFSGLKHRIQSIRSNEMLLNYNKNLSNLFYKYIQNLLSIYIVNSNDLGEKVSKNGFNKDKIVNIYNGIPIFYDLPIENESLDEIHIAYIARFHAVKNHKNFLQSLKLIAVNTKFKVHLFGSGILEKELKIYVNDNGLRDIVIFEGWKKDISKYLPNIDIVVLTSEGEGFNNSIAEAQMHGIPVVTTNCTGSSEIVIDNQTGFVVPVGDMNKFAKKLQVLIDSETLRQEFSRNAYTRFRGHFTIETMVDKYEQLFESLINRK